MIDVLSFILTAMTLSLGAGVLVATVYLWLTLPLVARGRKTSNADLK